MQAEKTIKKEVNVLHIEPHKVNEFWPLVEFMVTEGLHYEGNPMSKADIKDKVKKGALQLFIMFGSDDGEKNKVFGTFVTQVTQLPNFRQLEVLLLKGEKRQLWQKEAMETIEHIAVQFGCKKLYILARLGWKKAFEPFGWKMRKVVYEKELK